MSSVFNILSKRLRPRINSFDQIPGPRRIPVFGTAWKYFPIVGDFDVNKLHIAGARKLKQYGSVVREEVVPGVFIVNVFEPEDIEQVYKTEGKYPSRRSHLALLHYRKTRPHLYNTGGLLPENGCEWWRIRSNFQKSLSKIKDVRSFLPKTEEIFDEFFDKFIKPDEPIDDFLSLISRLNIEVTWMAMFGERLKSFEDANLGPNSVPSLLMEAAENANGSILSTDSTEALWKRFKTKPYKSLEKSLLYIEKIVYEEISKKSKLHLKNDKINPSSLIEHFFANPNVDFKDIHGMAVDLVLGGVDTTSYTSSFIIYHLANNKNAQEKLNEEASRLLENSKITPDVLNEAGYARAVLKESFRLNPISIGVSRNMIEDVKLGGYLVPKGTLVLTQNMVACRQEKHFTNAEAFIPERWIKGSKEYTIVSPYLILPFSHGPRTCIARRLAEQNLLTFILKIGKNYKLEWLGDNLEVETPLICKPANPVKVVFTHK